MEGRPALTRLEHIAAVARLDAADIRNQPLKVAVPRGCAHQLAERGLRGRHGAGRHREGRQGGLRSERQGLGSGSKQQQAAAAARQQQRRPPRRTSPDAASRRYPEKSRPKRQVRKSSHSCRSAYSCMPADQAAAAAASAAATAAASAAAASAVRSLTCAVPPRPLLSSRLFSRYSQAW